MLRNENVEVKGGSAGEREGGSKDPRGLKSACRLKPAPHVLGTIFWGEDVETPGGVSTDISRLLSSLLRVGSSGRTCGS